MGLPREDVKEFPKRDGPSDTPPSKTDKAEDAESGDNFSLIPGYSINLLQDPNYEFSASQKQQMVFRQGKRELPADECDIAFGSC